eukprot:m.303983 g.303983  ORF g.303983 m.303983 type:complete len:168 (+) comp16437_c0_seq19:3811-4314(+)
MASFSSALTNARFSVLSCCIAGRKAITWKYPPSSFAVVGFCLYVISWNNMELIDLSSNSSFTRAIVTKGASLLGSSPNGAYVSSIMHGENCVLHLNYKEIRPAVPDVPRASTVDVDSPAGRHTLEGKENAGFSDSKNNARGAGVTTFKMELSTPFKNLQIKCMRFLF